MTVQVIWVHSDLCGGAGNCHLNRDQCPVELAQSQIKWVAGGFRIWARPALVIGHVVSYQMRRAAW
jgi:hypothetical protein